ncbi:MAG: InlB B-repeat-containing protein [Clostridiales bacterium]|jgi:hypothetical protein|nr:InlB B-repeat-containing protein [Clostridiales bacterium]
MKGKFIRIVFAVMAAAVFAFGAVGCGGVPNSDQNDPGTEPEPGQTEQKPSYTVTFDVGAGEGGVTPQTVKDGERAVKPASDPRRYGSDFKGWSVTPLALVEFDFNAAIVKDTRLYAYWANKDEDLITVTFDNNGGTGDIPAQKSMGEGFVYYDKFPQKEGGVFMGWARSDKNDFSEVMVNYEETDMTLYACWGDADDDLDVLSSIAISSMVAASGMRMTYSDTEGGYIDAADYLDGAPALYYYDETDDNVVEASWNFADGIEYEYIREGETVTCKDKMRTAFDMNELFYEGSVLKEQLLVIIDDIVDIKDSGNIEKTADGYTYDMDGYIYEFTVSDGKITEIASFDAGGDDGKLTFTYGGVSSVPALPDVEWNYIFGATLAFPNGRRTSVSADAQNKVTFYGDDWTSISYIADTYAGWHQNGATAEVYSDITLIQRITADLILTSDITLYIKFVAAE